MTGTMATIWALLTGCPEPPPEIADALPSDQPDQAAARPNRGGPEGDPDSMDLSPGGTVLLDMSEVVPQKTQEEIAAAGETVTIAGTLSGTCTDGTLRIDVIELNVTHTDAGPMVGPLTALFPAATGDYTMVVPKGKVIQIAALCDVDNDNKIVQDTDKIAPGVALGMVEEDKMGVDLLFPGESEAPVEVGANPGSPNGDVKPPGDPEASFPSDAAGKRDAALEPPADEPPADEPPADEPPADEPPADEPPAE